MLPTKYSPTAVLHILFWLLTARGCNGQYNYSYYGGTMSSRMEKIDGKNMAHVEVITSWELGKGPCGINCSAASINAATQPTRLLGPSYFGSFHSDYQHRGAAYEENIENFENFTKTVIGVNEIDKVEQDLITFSVEIKSEGEEDINYEGHWWRSLIQGQHLFWHIQTRVSVLIRNDTKQMNHSPQILPKPFYRIKLNETSTIHLPVSDPDCDFVKCRLSRYVESGGLQPHEAPGVTVSDECVVTIDANSSLGYRHGSWIAVPVTVRDYSRSNILLGNNTVFKGSYPLGPSGVQFTVQIVETLSTPEFLQPTPSANQKFTVYIGATWRTDIFVVAQNNTTIKTITARGRNDEHYTLSSIKEDVSRVAVKYVTASWTPTFSDICEHIFCASAIDNTGVESEEQRCFILEVRSNDLNHPISTEKGLPYFIDTPSNLNCDIDSVCYFPVYVISIARIDVVHLTSTGPRNTSVSEVTQEIRVAKTVFKATLRVSNSISTTYNVCFVAVDIYNVSSDHFCVNTTFIPPDPCLSLPCLHGGTCNNDKLKGNYSCMCPEGYYGHNCNQKINFCEPNPCIQSNSLRCVDLDFRYKYLCLCKKGFVGNNCEIEHLQPSGTIKEYVTIDSGMDLMLNCSVKGTNISTTQWIKTNSCGGKLENKTDSVYRVTNSTMGDSGTYMCKDLFKQNVTKYFQVKINTKEDLCTFDQGSTCGWMQSSSDRTDWIMEKGPTLTDDTGPDTDHTLANDKGVYLFIESSAPSKEGDFADLKSPRFPGNETVCLEIWYHMYGTGIGTLTVYRQDSCSGTHTELFKRTGDQGEKWNRAAIDIAAQDVQNDYNIVIHAVIGSSYLGDIAIDDLMLKPGNCQGTISPAIVG